MASKRKQLFLMDNHIKNIIQDNGTRVDFCYGLSENDLSKLRERHVIDLLSNPKHVDKQKVTYMNLPNHCKGINNDSLIFIADQFPKLEDLWAFDCNISVLPDDFGDKLKHLKTLNLSKNKITTLPASIGKLNHLRELDLSDNNITSLPASIGKLNHLRELDLSDNSIITLPASIGKLNHLQTLHLYNNNITTLPASIGTLKHLQELFLHYNNITTLPASIASLAITCKIFRIDGNPLNSSKPSKEAANGVFQQGIKYHFEASRANTHNNDDNSKSPRLHYQDSTSTLTTYAGDVNEETVTSDTKALFAHRTQTKVSSISTISNYDAAADGALVVDINNNDNSATSLGKRRWSRQEKQDTTSATPTVTKMSDEQQVVIKLEPLDHQTTNDLFNQKDYDMLRTHYLQPKVRRNEEIPSGMHLRTRHAPAAIDGKTEGYKQLKRQIQKLEKDNDVNGIYRLLKALRRFEVERAPISSFICGDNDGDDEVTEIIDLTCVPDNDDDDVIDVDNFIIDFLLVKVIKADPDALPPSGTYELPVQEQLKKVKADPDTDA